MTRAFGLAQAVGSIFEGGVALTAGAATLETGIGVVAAGMVLGDAWDNWNTGIQTALTGQPHKTSFVTVAENLGVSTHTAENIQTGFGMVAGLEAGAKIISGAANTVGKGVKGAIDLAKSTTARVSKSGMFGKGSESVINAGGRQLTSAKAALSADREASNFYNQVRTSKSNADVIQISKNTGIAKYRIQRIKEHIFINEHTLSGGRIAQFDPYIEIADAWNRLQSGNFVKQDIQLLHHEYFESRFEGIFKTDYSTAHNIANKSGRIWDPEEFISPTPMMNRRS